jgi:hypothetical protein
MDHLAVSFQYARFEPAIDEKLALGSGHDKPLIFNQ